MLAESWGESACKNETDAVLKMSIAGEIQAGNGGAGTNCTRGGGESMKRTCQSIHFAAGKLQNGIAAAER